LNSYSICQQSSVTAMNLYSHLYLLSYANWEIYITSNQRSFKNNIEYRAVKLGVRETGELEYSSKPETASNWYFQFDIDRWVSQECLNTKTKFHTTCMNNFLSVPRKLILRRKINDMRKRFYFFWFFFLSNMNKMFHTFKWKAKLFELVSS